MPFQIIVHQNCIRQMRLSAKDNEVVTSARKQFIINAIKLPKDQTKYIKKRAAIKTTRKLIFHSQSPAFLLNFLFAFRQLVPLTTICAKKRHIFKRIQFSTHSRWFFTACAFDATAPILAYAYQCILNTHHVYSSIHCVSKHKKYSSIACIYDNTAELVHHSLPK